MSLPAPVDGFSQGEFFDVDGITMNGQTLSIDFMFSDGFIVRSNRPVWAEVFLQTAPHNPVSADGDYPYTQYVIFGQGTNAYLINERRERLDVPMSDWAGGTTTGPAPTFAVLSTDRGMAGGDLMAFPTLNDSIAGFHYDFVLPNTGEALYLGRIGLNIDIAKEEPAQFIDVLSLESFGLALPVTPDLISLVPDRTDVDQEELNFDPPIEVPVERIPITTSFTVPDMGAVTKATAGRGALLTGYGVLHPDEGQTTPSGILFLRDWRAGYLAAETAIPDAPLLLSGRTYVETSADGSVNTGIVVANPNPQEATIVFEIRDQDGSISRAGSFTLKGTAALCNTGSACNQLSRLVDDQPFQAARGMHGTITLTSNVPVSILAFRGFTNEQNTFLMTPLPVADLSEVRPSDVQAIPHFSIGYGSKTRVLLVNPGGDYLTGEVELFDSSGERVFFSIEGLTYRLRFFYTIPPNSSQVVDLLDAWPGPAYGWIRITPGNGTIAPAGFAILSASSGGVTTFETGVSPTTGTAFRAPVLTSPNQDQSGLAVANPTENGGTVWLMLANSDGSPIADTSFYLPPNGQWVDFVNSIFPSIAGQDFRGVLRITTDLPQIAATTFLMHTDPQQFRPTILTAIPPVLENGYPTTQDRFFPFFMNGEGFETRILVFSGKAGQYSAGTISFFHPDGSPFDVW